MRARTKRQQRCCVSHASGRACNPGRGARAARRTHRAVDADGGVPPPHFGGLLQVKATTLIRWRMNPSDVLQAPCGSARDRRRLTGSRSARLMMLVAAAAAAARDLLMRRCTRVVRCADLIGQFSVSSLSSSACLACEPNMGVFQMPHPLCFQPPNKHHTLGCPRPLAGAPARAPRQRKRKTQALLFFPGIFLKSQRKVTRHVTAKLCMTVPSTLKKKTQKKIGMSYATLIPHLAGRGARFFERVLSPC